MTRHLRPRFDWRVATALLTYAAAHGVALLDRGPQRDPAHLARDLTRPLVLPALWNEIDNAEQRGDLARAAALGHDLLKFLPEWLDGHVHFAFQLAIGLGANATDAAAELRLLEAGLAWLDETRQQIAPARAAELAAVQGTLIEARCNNNPRLADQIRSRTGRDPSEIALDYLDQAIALTPPGHGVPLRERRPFLLVQIVATAVRAGDLDRAATTLDAAIGLLGRSRDTETSAVWIEALRRIRPALLGEQLDLDSLAADPYLGEITRALQAR